MRELSRFFNVTVQNVHRGAGPSYWKHSIYQASTRPHFGDRTFCVCLVKDPAFWIQSLARNPIEGTFYEILPMAAVRNPLDGQIQCMSELPQTTRQLFSTVFFQGVLYPDALSLWEATVASYFDEAIFPTDRTAVVRCEDFQFNFESVIRALAKRGLPLRDNRPDPIQPLDETAKDSTHPDCTR